MKNKYSWILYLILAVVFAYDVVTAGSTVVKVIRGILVIVLCAACYGEFKSLKNKK